MGLQNAIITKLSNPGIRTTHVTGMVTDIGIEHGKLFCRNGHRDSFAPRVVATGEKIKLLAVLIGCFLLRGALGAQGFKHAGFVSVLLLALMLVVLALALILDDNRRIAG